MRRTSAVARFRRDKSGVAAIEMALVLPVLLIIFLGMIDVTAILADNRKLSYSANAVADVVSRLDATTTPALITDSFKAVEVVMKSAQPGPVRVEVYNFRKSGALISQVWKRDNGTGTACSQVSTANFLNLMTAGNDLIVAVTCATYVPILFRLFQRNTLGRASITMREQLVIRPRFSLLMECPTCT